MKSEDGKKILKTINKQSASAIILRYYNFSNFEYSLHSWNLKATNLI